MDVHQFRMFVVLPTLTKLGLYSVAADKLVVGTALHESMGLTYIDQVTMDNPDKPGPAYGVCQMESATYWDIRNNFLPSHDALRTALTGIRAEWPIGPLQLMTNFAYAVAMCRIHYFRVPVVLPNAADLPGLAAYYKKYYNSELGAATPEQWIANFHRYNADREYN